MTESNDQESIEQLDQRTMDYLKSLADATLKNFKEINEAQYGSIVDYTEQKKLTDSPHEIIFDVTALVLEENEKGETVGTKEICTKKYHIPVPINKDYDVFMKTFFSHIEECLLSAANKAHE